MATKRKTKTKAKADYGAKDVSTGCCVGEPYRPPDRLSISARKISNGWVVNKSGYENGKHFDTDVFSPTKPSIQFEALKREGRLTGKEI